MTHIQVSFSSYGSHLGVMSSYFSEGVLYYYEEGPQLSHLNIENAN